MIIGICGKSGSGKSTLARKIIKITNNNAIHLDIDKIGHNVLLLPEVKNELVNLFGKGIINEKNIDRKKLGDIVFNSRFEMDKLSNITWKYMEIEIDKFIQDNRDRIIILDWLLLPNTKYLDLCDIKILLNIPYEIRKERAMKRDNIKESDFDLREKASIEYNENDFDYILVNNNYTKRMVKDSDKSFVSREF